MVRGISDEERSSFARKVKIGFVLLVGLSAGLTTLQTDAGTTVFLGATAAGLLVGVALVWLVFPDRDDLARNDSSRSRRRGRR